MPRFGSGGIRMSKQRKQNSTKKFSSKKKTSEAHVSRQHMKTKNTQHTEKHLKSADKHSQRAADHEKKTDKSKRKHEERLEQINNNKNLSDSQRERMLADEHTRRGGELTMEAHDHQALADGRQRSLAKHTYQTNEEGRLHDMRKYPLQYGQMRGYNNYLFYGGGGVYLPGSAGYLPGNVGYAGGPGYLPPDVYQGSPSATPQTATTSQPEPDSDSEEELPSQDSAAYSSQSLAPSHVHLPPVPLPDPSTIAALSDVSLCAAHKFLRLRAEMNAETDPDEHRQKQLEFILFIEQLDHVLHTHMIIYVRVMKYRPKPWSVIEAEQYVDRLSREDLDRLVAMSKDDLSNYLRSLS